MVADDDHDGNAPFQRLIFLKDIVWYDGCIEIDDKVFRSLHIDPEDGAVDPPGLGSFIHALPPVR